MTRTRNIGVATGLVLAALLMLPVPPAGAQQVGPSEPDGSGTDTFVTIAARECDEYTDVRANLARNDIMESLQDLGPDTLYSPGDQIDPRTETAGQPACRPLVGWRFTLGSGYQTQAVSGVWGSLSKVLNPDTTSIVTRASVPARGYQGEVLSGQRIAAATTIELSDDQLSRTGGNALWLQGGEPDDPVLYGDPFFAGRYGFAALRCAIDDLNGDNVETIQYPSGVRHVFCYAYYVTPPPSSGTIAIRKQVQGDGAYAESFPFSGNVSYNPGGAFDLDAGPGSPGSSTFYRAETRPGDDPWTVTETVPAGWVLTGLDCSAGASTVQTDVRTGRVSIALAAGDTVTCIYTDRPAPTAAAVLVRKVTRGGTGRFDFQVRNDQSKTVATREARTTQPGVAAAAGKPILVQPGRYSLTELLPPSRDGVWRRVGARCNDTEFGARGAVTGTVSARSGIVCTITNQLDRPGRIRLSKVTLGGTGEAAFVVSPLGDPTVQRRQSATTTRPGRAARARGQSLSRLPFGRYVIQESAALPEDRGSWTSLTVRCNRELVPFAQGRAVVRLTRSEPEQDCRFINQRNAPGPTPPAPPGPAPEPGGDGSDVTIAKRLVATTGGGTPIQTWRITVTNEGEVSANGVVVTDQLPRGTAFASARVRNGSCFDRGGSVTCAIGGLAAGAERTITVRVRRFDRLAGTNVAVVGTGSPDATGNNTARVSVAGAQRPRACATGTSRARAAC